VKRQGFSLVEILVALMISSIVGALLYSILSQTVRTTDRVNSSVDTQGDLWIVSEQLERDITGIVLLAPPELKATDTATGQEVGAEEGAEASQKSMVQSMKSEDENESVEWASDTMPFVGSLKEGKLATLSFITTSALPDPEHPGSRLVRVRYFLQPQRGDASVAQLMREESVYSAKDAGDASKARAYSLLSRVESLTASRSWRTIWGGSNSMTQRRGFILVTVIMLVGMMTLLVTRMMLRLTAYDRLNTVLVRRAQAKLLAWSGVQMALAQIMQKMPDSKSEGNELFIEQILFKLRKTILMCNRWQKVQLTEEADGVDGTCAFYIACEGGKINVNALYDHTLQTTAQNTVLDELGVALQKAVKPWNTSVNVLKRAEVLLEKRGTPLNDVTELFADEQLKPLFPALFLNPESTFSLTDALSIERSGQLLQPWALSGSIESAYDLKRTETISEEQWEFLNKAFTQEAAGPGVWEKLFTVLYGENRSQQIQELYPLFNQRFEADLFSVISYGAYTDVIVMLYALIQLRRETGEDGTERTYGNIKRVYWIYDARQISTTTFNAQGT